MTTDIRISVMTVIRIPVMADARNQRRPTHTQAVRRPTKPMPATAHVLRVYAHLRSLRGSFRAYKRTCDLCADLSARISALCDLCAGGAQAIRAALSEGPAGSRRRRLGRGADRETRRRRRIVVPRRRRCAEALSLYSLSHSLSLTHTHTLSLSLSLSLSFSLSRAI